jgi:hypothetical protein
MRIKKVKEFMDNRQSIILVPGESEFIALPKLLRRFQVTVQPQIIKCIASKGDKIIISPKVFNTVKAALKRNPQKIILLFDREDSLLCPGEFARGVKNEVIRSVRGISDEVFSVVCSDHCVENWALADPNVFKCKLFKKDLFSRIDNRADCKPAQKIIQEGFGNNKHYQKTRHLSDLLSRVDISNREVRKRSPSLDKFLRELGIP